MRLGKLSLLVLAGLLILSGCSRIGSNTTDTSLPKPEIISIDLPDEFPIKKRLNWFIEVNKATDSLEISLYLAGQETDWIEIWNSGPQVAGYFTDRQGDQGWGLPGFGGSAYPSRYEFRVRAWNQSHSVSMVKSFKLVAD
ncbi:hypothetical protein IID20_00330 [Patescibacteria group bacterium]|nr:hypothetical protein [Patescibacteria group bacterium]